MRTPLVIGNWKMNGDGGQCRRLVDLICLNYTPTARSARVVVCPPSLYLRELNHQLEQNSNWIKLGAQNVSDHISGAYTGELSAPMLKDAGCDYVLIGHSERRALFAEDNIIVARKVLAVLRASMVPVLCVGETLSEFELGQTQKVVTKQVMDVVSIVGIQHFSNVVIAYEPAWAVSSGQMVTAEYAQCMHEVIRQALCDRDEEIGQTARIIYGGSITSTNAANFLQLPDIDGVMVGGASLSADQFVSICALANRQQFKIAS